MPSFRGVAGAERYVEEPAAEVSAIATAAAKQRTPSQVERLPARLATSCAEPERRQQRR